MRRKLTVTPLKERGTGSRQVEFAGWMNDRIKQSPATNHPGLPRTEGASWVAGFLVRETRMPW